MEQNTTIEQCEMIAKSKTRLFKREFVILNTVNGPKVFDLRSVPKSELKNIVKGGTR